MGTRYTSIFRSETGAVGLLYNPPDIMQGLDEQTRTKAALTFIVETSAGAANTNIFGRVNVVGKVRLLRRRSDQGRFQRGQCRLFQPRTNLWRSGGVHSPPGGPRRQNSGLLFSGRPDLIALSNGGGSARHVHEHTHQSACRVSMVRFGWMKEGLHPVCLLGRAISPPMSGCSGNYVPDNSPVSS